MAFGTYAAQGMLRAYAILAVGCIITLACNVMMQISSRLGRETTTNQLVTCCDSDARLPRDRLGRLGTSINKAAFNAGFVGRIAEQTLIGIGVLIVGGSESACFDRDGRCSAYYNGGISPIFTPA
jgi:hypothetical protein